MVKGITNRGNIKTPENRKEKIAEQPKTRHSGRDFPPLKNLLLQPKIFIREVKTAIQNRVSYKRKFKEIFKTVYTQGQFFSKDKADIKLALSKLDESNFSNTEHVILYLKLYNKGKISPALGKQINKLKPNQAKILHQAASLIGLENISNLSDKDKNAFLSLFNVYPNATAPDIEDIYRTSISTEKGQVIKEARSFEGSNSALSKKHLRLK